MRDPAKPLPPTPAEISRRRLLAGASAAGLGLALGRRRSSAQAPSDTLNVAVMGVNGRGRELARAFQRTNGCRVGWICDVDSTASEACVGDLVAAGARHAILTTGDVRRVLDRPEVDALVIAAPDHWHAPAALMALDAGKHVYVEKPCGHNPREGEVLVEASRRRPQLVVQMGTQQRSAPESMRAVEMIRNGIIGRPYLGRCWYANTRSSIGTGRVAAVPSWLDWELWQGPAPRTDYRDNLVHYNWHWFWNWGTGEICNNATHEIDFCRWALDVGLPTRVGSSGGRYHFDDDWQFWDTQIATYEFGHEASIVWEGRSCNGLKTEGRGRGSAIHGEKGTIIVDRQGYVVYDQEDQEIARDLRLSTDDALDTRAGGDLTDLHVENFAESVRGRQAPRAAIDEGHRSTLLCHLGNIAQKVGRSLDLDPANGHILEDSEASAMWGREYEPGWEPRA